MKGFVKAAGLLLAGALFAAPAAAQSHLVTGGLMANKDILMPSNFAELSQTQFNFGTARSMAMAGAFTSLGADLSSMAVNPAGLGMYRHNEISITPLVTMTRAQNSAEAWNSNASNRFALSSFGFVFNLYEGTGRTTSVNFGFGYNRLADLNYRSSFRSTGNVGSIADMYALQLEQSGLDASDITGNNLDWFNQSPELWPAILGYKAGMVDQTARPDGSGSWWNPSWIGGDRNNIDIGHYAGVESRGSVGEYDLSLGANFGNKLYVGVTLGIQAIHQELQYTYAEDYYYPGGTTERPEGVASDLRFQQLWSKLNQATVTDGAGVNLKLGLTYRPIPALRIGVAFHTPTYYSLETRYQGASLGVAVCNDPDYNPGPGEYPQLDGNGYIDCPGESPVLSSKSWAFTTPARLLFGASYSFGGRAVISVDYERAWFNGIRVKETPSFAYAPADYNGIFRSNFKGSNTLRVGAEFKPLPILALRAGFGYSGSWLAGEDADYSSPLAREIIYYGAGVGINLSRTVTLDVAYSYQKTKQNAYWLYYADLYTGSNVEQNSSALYKTDYARHAVALTLAFRF